MTAFKDNLYELKVYGSQSLDGVSDDGVIESAALVFVYDAGTKTLATLYSSTGRATLANPMTRAQFTTEKGIRFYAEANSVDIVVNTDKGFTGTYSGVTPYIHTLKVNTASADRCLVFPMLFNAGATEVDTGLDLPKFSAVYDAQVEVVTLDAGETVDIGTLTGETAADPNGFVAAASVATAGFVQPTTVTVGGSETFVAATTYGALLATLSAGSDVATDVGAVVRKSHFVAGSDAVSISYTPSTSDTFAGYGYVFFRVLR